MPRRAPDRWPYVVFALACALLVAGVPGALVCAVLLVQVGFAAWRSSLRDARELVSGEPGHWPIADGIYVTQDDLGYAHLRMRVELWPCCEPGSHRVCSIAPGELAAVGHALLAADRRAVLLRRDTP